MDDLDSPGSVPAAPDAGGTLAEPGPDHDGMSPDERRQAYRARRSQRAGGRRAARRSGGTPAGASVWFVVALVALIVIGVVGWLGYGAVTERARAEGRLNDGLELLKKADIVVVRTDQVIGGQLTADMAEAAAAAERDLPGAQKDLDAAAKLLALARADLRPEDQALADAARASAQARTAMLAQAAPLLSANRKAAGALGPSGEAWQMMLEAAATADSAVQKYNLRTEAGVKESNRLTGEADTRMRKARDLMSQAASSFPEAGLGLYVEYADDEIKALAKSKETNAAWLAGDKSKANDLAKEFNKLEDEASALAKNLDAPSAAISKAFDLLVVEANAAYQQARSKAADADAKLTELTAR